MFRLDNILEHWATLYAPLSHDIDTCAKHRTFFRISMIDANSEFVRNFATTPSPAMAYSTHYNAEMGEQNPNVIRYRHAIYFMAKQQSGTLSKTAATNELAATEARFYTDELAQDLIAVLKALKSMANGKSLPKEQRNGLSSDMIAWLQSTAADPEYHDGLRGLQVEQANWGTIPLPNGSLNGWQLCGLTIEQFMPRLLCVNPQRYV